MINCIRQQKFLQEPSMTMQNRSVDSSTVTIWYNNVMKEHSTCERAPTSSSILAQFPAGVKVYSTDRPPVCEMELRAWERMLAQVHTLVVSPLRLIKL